MVPRDLGWSLQKIIDMIGSLTTGEWIAPLSKNVRLVRLVTSTGSAPRALIWFTMTRYKIRTSTVNKEVASTRQVGAH